MNKIFKPKDKDELLKIIKEIIDNQLSDTSYPYGLKDVDTSLITDMSEIFSCYEEDINYEINRKIDWNDPKNDITQWDISNVTDMVGMFEESTFNQNINSWDVSNVNNMSYMLDHTPFNQDISSWNISNVTDMFSMFYNSEFNQDISKWIFTLNRDCNLYDFNYNSQHQEKFGTIDGYDDFIKIHITKDFINEIFKNGSDIEKYELLKIIKQYPDIIKDLNIGRELL